MSQVTTRPILKDVDVGTTWSRIPFQVEFGQIFKTQMEKYKHILGMKTDDSKLKHKAPTTYIDEDKNVTSKVNMSKGMSEFDMANYMGIASELLAKPYWKDTRLGANDAINCVWQFNRDDDIVHPINYSTPERNGIGEGRVYASTIEKNQVICSMSFGYLRFASVGKFWAAALNAKVAEASMSSFISGLISNLAIKGVSLLIDLTLAPFTWTRALVAGNKDTQVSRYFEFRETMHVYYQYVDAITVRWLLLSGMMSGGKDEGITDAIKKSFNPEDQLPDALRVIGSLHIENILMNRARNLRATGNQYIQNIIQNPDYLNEQAIKVSQSTFFDFSEDKDNIYAEGNMFTEAGMKFAMLSAGATHYIGFRIEKNTSASESFSNSTQPSEIAQKVNQHVREMNAKKFNLMADSASGNFTGIADKILQSVAVGIDSIIQIAGSGFGFLTGMGFLDIPDSYADSQFNKSHNLSFNLRSPYGDPSSIFQSIIVPLACILAGGLPRGVGVSSYMHPFYCRVYIPGLWNIPCGIFESINIERGSSEFGWSVVNRLPTCVNVSLGIKDLAAIMYVGMMSKYSGITEIIEAGNTFDEYLSTLAGIGIRERVALLSRIKKKMQSTMLGLRHSLFSGSYWISTAADLVSSPLASLFVSHNYLPR